MLIDEVEISQNNVLLSDPDRCHADVARIAHEVMFH
jgi:hypothetical protein